MLYLFYGDFDEVRKSLSKKIKELGLASSVSLSSESFVNGTLDHYIENQDLFSDRTAIILPHFLEDRKIASLLGERLVGMRRSENVFFLLEREVSESVLKGVKEVAAETVLCPALSRDEPEFNVFSLTDAFLEKDKRKLWVLYMHALRAGVDPEEVYRVLFWQTKNLSIVSREKGPTGLKPFVEGKARKALSRFSLAEVQRILGRLLDLQIKARSGKGDFGIGLESFILSL